MEISSDPRVRELHAAARAADVATVKRLLAAGADPHALRAEGYDTAMWIAVAKQRVNVIRAMGAAGVDLNQGWPHTPLTLAARMKNPQLIRALVESGADVNRPDSSGQTPLLTAVLENNLKSVAELVRLGADPNLVPKKKGYDHISNSSPLRYAASTGNKRILAALREATSVKSVTGKARTALAVTELCGAAASGDLAEVKRLVEQEGVDVNAKDDQRETPLIHAARNHNPKVVRYLLDHGADVNLAGGRKSDEVSPLMAGCDSLAITRMLVEAGADLDYTMKQYPDDTTLDMAKQSRAKKVVGYLLEVQKQRGGVRKTKPGKVKAAGPRGVTTFDTNDAIVLVAAPVAAVSKAFADRIGAKRRREDVLGDDVKLTKRCYAVCKLLDSPWTIVMKIYCANYEHLPRADDARALSKLLRTRALHVTNSDTAGVNRYALFDAGTLVELFDFGSVRDTDDPGHAARQFATWGLDIAAIPGGVQVAKSMTFASALRSVKIAKIKNDPDFVNDYIKQQDAFVPFGFDDEWGEAGETVELTLEGLGPDDVERLDFIAAR